MLYCKNCNIIYDDSSDYFQDEYQKECPMCILNRRLKSQQSKINSLNLTLTKYKICEECQRINGDCDKDRNTCRKLQQELN